MPNRWPHQSRAITEYQRLRLAGCKRICITSPTGGGKSLITRDLIDLHDKSALYLDRCMLFEQTNAGLDLHGLHVGHRASGRDVDYDAPVQLCMRQTENNMVNRYDVRDVHPADLVVWDEAHNQSAEAAQKLMNRHLQAHPNAVIVGTTATPCGLGHVYDELVVAGTNSDMRRCGAHVPAYVYAPNEPDLKKNTEDVTETVARNAMGKVTKGGGPMGGILLHGNIIGHWLQHNPEQRPTIGFAPGVPESRWLCQEFERNGIPSAHIDGDIVILRGEQYDADTDTRQKVIDAYLEGDVKVLWNRFVLREGIDLPSTYCCIIATVFGSVTSYVQSVGRVLRAHPTLSNVCIIDHGGNWWRHGSPNANREWDLNINDRQMCSMRRETLRNMDFEESEKQPLTCPQCGMLRKEGRTCPGCGHSSRGLMRRLVTTDGKLKRVEGQIYKHRPYASSDNDRKDWTGKVHGWRKHKPDGTFAQLRADYMRLHGWKEPHPHWEMQPKYASDWSLPVGVVPVERLTGWSEK